MFELLLITMLYKSLKDIKIESEVKMEIVKNFRNEIKKIEEMEIDEPKTE